MTYRHKFPVWRVAAPVLLAALASGAAAQDVDYRARDLLNCLEDRAPDRWERCIGEASDRCMERPDGQSTNGSVQCMAAELDNWDMLLNATYQDLRDATRAADLSVGVDPDDGAHEALRQMQIAWIAYRDASCDFVQARSYGGSMGRQAATYCQMDLTAQQALRLLRHSAEY